MKFYPILKSLKNSKASGLDRISNEMFKSGQNFLTRPLCKLFNIILKSGCFKKELGKKYNCTITQKG